MYAEHAEQHQKLPNTLPYYFYYSAALIQSASPKPATKKRTEHDMRLRYGEHAE